MVKLPKLSPFSQPHSTQANPTYLTVKTDYYKYSQMMNKFEYLIELEQCHIILKKCKKVITFN